MQFVTDDLVAELVAYRIAHVNADFPADQPGDGPRGTSDHDPSASRFTTLPDLDRLADLVRYYVGTGQVSGRQTEAILLDRLERAERLLESGHIDAYRDQLLAFVDQVGDLTPRHVAPIAARALEVETEVLLGLD